jgi:hypothetical protein
VSPTDGIKNLQPSVENSINAAAPRTRGLNVFSFKTKNVWRVSGDLKLLSNSQVEIVG